MSDIATIPAHEAAHTLGVPQRTMSKHCQTGRIPAVKIGRVWYISAATFESIQRAGVPLLPVAVGETPAPRPRTSAPTIIPIERAKRW